MDILNEISDDTLLIIPVSLQEKIIKEIRQKQKLLNVKFITLDTFFKKYYFSYDEEAIYYLMNKYNYKYEIAEMYLSNLIYLEKKEYQNEKIEFLQKIKNELDEQELLKYNPMFKDYLRRTNVIVWGYDTLDKFEQKTLNNLTNVKIIYPSSNNYNHTIYQFNSIDEEVIFVANQICKLIDNNIDINKIKLANVQNEYIDIIKKVFFFYNLPVDLKEKEAIYSTTMAKTFLNNYHSSLEECLKSLDIYDLQNVDNLSIYNQLIKICNSCSTFNNEKTIREFLIHKLKHTYITDTKLANKIEIVDIANNIIDDDQYVFLLSFNQGVYPTIYKDDDYFTNYDKKVLELEDINQKNINSKKMAFNAIKRIKNLIISYKLKSLTGDYSISNINETLNYEIKTSDDLYGYSNEYNKILLASYMDNLIKYGDKNNNLDLLYANYNILYMNYNNKYEKIDDKLLLKALNNKLLLSYSSVNNYYKCNFRYYLSNILKLDIYEETFMINVGTIFHAVLSQAFDENFDFGYTYDIEIKKVFKCLSAKEKFFLNKLQKELLFVINTIKNQYNYSTLDKALYEEKVYINKDKNIKVTFMGVIDKLLYKDIDNKTVVAIIDYKTGNQSIKLSSAKYGIDMQLPIYVYLAKNTNKIKNVEVAGFYLQKILDNEIVKDYKHTYEQLKRDRLKLLGYSNKDERVLSLFDKTYKDSEIIHSMRLKNDGGFYYYSKIIDNKQIDNLVDMVDKKIDMAIDNILNAEFDINPKRIGSNCGCDFCKFKDICYVEEKDYIDLEEISDNDFLGGDLDA